MLLSAYGRTCSAPAGLSRGLLLVPAPSKVRWMQDSYMLCMQCVFCMQNMPAFVSVNGACMNLIGPFHACSHMHGPLPQHLLVDS